MKFDFQFACDQLSSTNHSALLDVSSSASCQHILTMCIHICTYMDTLPLRFGFLYCIHALSSAKCPSDSMKVFRNILFKTMTDFS